MSDVAILLFALVGIILMDAAFYVGLRARWRVLDALEEIRRAERETWRWK